MLIRLRRHARVDGKWCYVGGWDNDRNEPLMTTDQAAAMTFKSMEEAERLRAMSPLLHDFAPVFGVFGVFG